VSGTAVRIDSLSVLTDRTDCQSVRTVYGRMSGQTVRIDSLYGLTVRTDCQSVRTVCTDGCPDRWSVTDGLPRSPRSRQVSGSTTCRGTARRLRGNCRLQRTCSL